MAFLGWLRGGNDRDLAKQLGGESASAKAARERRHGHRNGGATKAARKGQAWVDSEFDRLR
ncbi:hypothetical protein [Streptomyces sp. NPDC088733]|uniref:hypothetical protein n=1 Tax=Streptomyces sp. NPDC088733 TaxID=3365880 RepID=UPI00380E8902